MKVFRTIGRTVKPFVNFPRWMGLDHLLINAKQVLKVAKEIFTPPKAKRKETFDAAIYRLGLSEDDIQRQMKVCLRLALMYIIVASLVLLYVVRLFAELHIAPALLGLAIISLFISLAYREHFWYFQMKQRRLGCTIQEWLGFVVRKG